MQNHMLVELEHKVSSHGMGMIYAKSLLWIQIKSLLFPDVFVGPVTVLLKPKVSWNNHSNSEDLYIVAEMTVGFWL